MNTSVQPKQLRHLLCAASFFGALLLLGAPLATHAQDASDRIDTTVVLARDGSIHLGLISGEIRVVGSERSDVRITASIERGRLESSFTDTRVSISARSINGRMGIGRYDVAVPYGTRVTASSISGLIDIRATRAEVTARSTSGEIVVRDARDRVEASTVSGDIDIHDASGRFRLESVSGDIIVQNGSGEASAESVSGSIAMRRSRFDAIRATAVSGSLSYEGPLSANGSYRLNSHSGSVVLTLPADVGATLELETFSGRISSDFPLTLQPGEGTARRNRRMEFTLGNGGARVVAGAFSAASHSVARARRATGSRAMQTRLFSMTRTAFVATLLLVSAAAADAQQESTTWNWKGELGNGRTVHLRNVNGEVRFEQGTGNTVEVTAVKRWTRGDPDDVRIEARMTGSGDGDVLICALWDDRGRCEVDNYRGGNSNDGWRRNNNVAVDFTIRVPAHAVVDASTVNGDLIISGTTAAVRAHTVNGDIEARSSTGRVSAETVNGSITVRTTIGQSDDVEFETVNGSITIELPANTNADVELRTVNGRIASEFPLTLEGSINPRRIQASIGSGGPDLRARTVNGSIRLEKF